MDASGNGGVHWASCRVIALTHTQLHTQTPLGNETGLLGMTVTLGLDPETWPGGAFFGACGGGLAPPGGSWNPNRPYKLRYGCTP